MSPREWAAVVLLAAGAVTTLVAAIGLARFDDVLPRLHVTSKPQMFGLSLIMVGTAVAVGTWAAAGMLLLVLLAQMITVPVSSTMMARAVFRRGFVTEGAYAIDELTPRLARSDDEDEDEDGFADEYQSPLAGQDEEAAATALPSNVLPEHELVDNELGELPNWDEPEAGPLPGEDADLDVDLEDETEREAGSIALEDERDRIARAEAHAARQATRHR